MGQAAALSGGYGNSYAQTAGQQMYDAHLQQLNDVVPELYNAAMQKYQMEGNDMYNAISMLQGLDESQYGRYRDDVGDYYNDLSYYYNKFNDMSDSEYNRYLNDASAWERDRDYWYAKQQDAQSQSNWEQEFNLTKSKSSGSSGGSGGSSQYDSIKNTLEEMYNNGASQEEMIFKLFDYDISSSDRDNFESYIAWLAGGLSNENKSSGNSPIRNYDNVDWESMLSDSNESQRLDMLYGYTEEGRAYMNAMRNFYGNVLFEQLRRKYGTNSRHSNTSPGGMSSGSTNNVSK